MTTPTEPPCGKTYATHWDTWQTWDDDCDLCGFRMTDADRRLAAWPAQRALYTAAQPRSPQLDAFLRRSAANPPPNRVDDINRLRARTQGNPVGLLLGVTSGVSPVSGDTEGGDDDRLGEAVKSYVDQLRKDADRAEDDGVAVGLLRAADGLDDLLTEVQP